MPGSDWAADDHFRVETGYVKTMLNPYDESALELTLKYADQLKKADRAFHLTAITVDGKQADTHLKTLAALRFDKIVRMENSYDLRFMPEVIAAALATFARESEKADLVVMGCQGGVGDNAKTPLLVAENLGWPCITRVTAVETPGTDEANSLKVISAVDGGVLEQTVTPPMVLSVGNAPGTYLRVPTLKDKVEHGKKPVELLDINEFVIGSVMEEASQNLRLKGLAPVSHQRESRVIEGENPAQKAKSLYESCLKRRLK